MPLRIVRKLEVHEAREEDIYKDIARIPAESRGDIKQGRICRVCVNGHAKLLIVRGAESEAGWIMLDAITRQALNVEQIGLSHDFTITEGRLGEKVWWAMNVADSGARIAAWIGLVSFFLGLVGILLGAYSIWLAYFPPR